MDGARPDFGPREIEDREIEAREIVRRRVVRSGYDAIGERYHDCSHRNPTRLGMVQGVLDRLPAGSTVVDLGCGPGDPATRLLAERHRVLGVDLSMSQLRIARRLAPTSGLVQADLLDLALAPRSVDAVVSFYALGHLPAHAHQPLLRRIAGWLRPGGLLVTSALLTAGDAVEDDWLGVPMFFGGIGAQATLEAAANAGLMVEHAVEIPEDEGDGRTVAFLWLTATKPLSK
ncbi:MAG: class I SAM-dependent methyltransferase [Actinomycetes bacterium]